MKEFLLTSGQIIGGLFIGFGLPIGDNIFPGNYDLLFIPFGLVLLLISYYYTFIKK